jgi:hypothetical protein
VVPYGFNGLTWIIHVLDDKKSLWCYEHAVQHKVSRQIPAVLPQQKASQGTENIRYDIHKSDSLLRL